MNKEDHPALYPMAIAFGVALSIIVIICGTMIERCTASTSQHATIPIVTDSVIIFVDTVTATEVGILPDRIK